MKLLSVKTAHYLWFIRTIDLNPHGLNEWSFIDPIVKKYKFLQVPDIPTKPSDIDFTKGFKLAGGSFRNHLQHDIGVELTIFSDGFVVDTRSSTKQSDAFLDEFLNRLANEFGLVPYQEVLRSKVYLSELWVKTDKSLNALNPKLAKFSEHLTSLIKGHYPAKYETSGIIFGTEPISVTPPPLLDLKGQRIPLMEKNVIILWLLSKQMTIFNYLRNSKAFSAVKAFTQASSPT